MGNLSYIPSFYFYRFADAVSSPYTALGAYSSGAIDANGNIKGNEGSIDPFEYFVIKIKKIFDQLPPGTTKYKLQNLMGTLQVFNEEAEKFGITKEQFDCLVESHVMLNAEDGVSYLNLLEDMTTGSAGGGAGTLGTPAEAPEANKGNVSGYDPVMGSMMTRSGPVNMFPSIEMFNVSKDEFNAFKAAKAWKQLQDSRTKKYLQRFQRRNKAGKMAVRDEESGEIFFIPYNEKSLVEELNLERLDILKETTESFIEPETGEQELYWITYPFKNFLGEGKNDPLETMVQNVVNPPPEDFSKKGKPIPGVAIERVGRLVLGAQSIINANRTGSRELVRGVEDKLQDIAGKPVPKNGTDSFYLNPKTLEIEGKDIKGHTQTPGGRINVQDYGEYGQLTDIMGKVRETIRNPDIDPKYLERVKAETRAALRQLDQTHGSKLRDVALENETGEDLAVFRDVSSKKFRFPYLPTFVPAATLRKLLAQSNFRFGLQTRPPSKDEPGRAEVKVRPSPDFSTQKAQAILVKDSGTGEMTSAQMDPETIDLILARIQPGLRTVMKQTLEPYVIR